MDVHSQKNQFEFYLDEYRSVDKNVTFDIISFWKGNKFRYHEVASIARDILNIHVSTIVS